MSLSKKSKLIIRAHGISKEVYDTCQNKGIEIIDATCPKVKNIHEIVYNAENEGYSVIIIGDRNHPEVKGINGWAKKASIIDDIQDIENINIINNNICVVAQTTYSIEKYDKIKEVIKSKFCNKNISFNDTICSATKDRQEETIRLSNKSDCMIIIGGKNSSNSIKLYEIAKKNCNNSFFIQDVKELEYNSLKDFEVISVMAGASVSNQDIENAVLFIENIDKKIRI